MKSYYKHEVGPYVKTHSGAPKGIPTGAGGGVLRLFLMQHTIKMMTITSTTTPPTAPPTITAIFRSTNYLQALSKLFQELW